MERSIKKIMTVFLAFLLVFGAMPTGSFALSPDLEITNPGADAVTPLPAKLDNGQVWTDKSVAYDGGGEFTITLSAIGQNYKRTEHIPGELVDVVLVLDVSGSMGSGEDSKLESMKTAAQNAVDILLGVTGNRVAVVKYSNMASVVSGFSTDAATLKTGIGGFGSGGGTNIQNGFLTAQNLIQGRSSSETNKPIIILMSDGRPTYYHTVFTEHTTGNRSGNGNINNTTGTFVMQTIRQAMEAKAAISDLKIYTIGFGVGSDAYAIATLMPTEENTAAYRSSIYSGETRTATQTGVVQYERSSSNNGNTWNSWNPSEPGDDGYVAPVYDPATGTWSAFSGMSSQPQDSWGDPAASGVVFNTSYTDNSGQNRRQIGYFNVTRTGTQYQNVTSEEETFNHKYWEEGSTITGDDGGQAIFDAFVAIVDSLVNMKPLSYTTNGEIVYSDIVIEDVLGPQFEVLGALPGGVAQSGSTLTWTLDGNSFQTHPADSTALDLSKINQVSFKVKLKSDASVGGPYYTNNSAEGRFAAGADNPCYVSEIDKNIVQPLSNNGWLSLAGTDVDVSIDVTKTVAGPSGWTDSKDRTFTFSFYYNDPTQGDPGSPIVGTPLSITVNGAGSKTETQALTIPASAFGGGSSLTLYVQENQTAPAGWTYDSVKPVTISKSGPDGLVTFVNEYHPKGSLTVTKAWSGSAPNGEVSFKLQKETGTGVWSDVSAGHLLNAGNEWSLAIGGLDLGINYRVVEDTTAENLYDYTASYSPATVSFDGSNLSRSIAITNTYNQPVGKINVNKVWNHGENPEADRPTGIVYNYDGPDAGTEADGQLTLTADGNWSNYIEVAGADKFGTYTFTEVVPADYQADAVSKTVTISLTPPASRESEVTFTNTYVTPTGSLTVTKAWANEGGNESYRPGTVTIDVYKDGGETPVNSVTFPQQDDTPWSHTFTGLAMGSYSVEENPAVPDYTTSYSAASVTLTKAHRSDGITVTNTFDNPKGSITVDKVWVEGGLDKDAVRPGAITVSLMKGALEVGSIALPKAGDVWNHTFTGLDLEGTYTVTESASGEDAGKLANYEAGILYGGDGGSADGVTLTSSDRSGTATLTNTYAKGTITVIKSWVDLNNPLAEQPQEAVVTLFKVTRTPILTEQIVSEGDENGLQPLMELMITGFDTTIEEVGTKTIARPDTAVVFYDLEMDEDVSYYVTEAEIPFYATAYTVDPENPEEYLVLGDEAPNGQITVTNTYTDPKGSLTVTKDWNHGNNPESAWPDSVTVQLKMNNGNVGEPVELSGSDWSHTFDGLTLGAVYTVAEESVNNYSTTYGSITSYTPVKGTDSVACGSITITNTYIPEVGSLTVEKKWEGTTGGAVTVTITREYGGTPDEDFRQSVELNSEYGWSHTFTGLEIYGPGGVLYSYKATESGDLTLYTVTNNDTPSLNKETAATITITNTYAPNKGKLIITKVWLDETGEPANPPVTSIGAILIVDGVTEQAIMTLGAGNNWTVERAPLSVNSTYSVEEINVPEEYEVTYEPAGAVGFDSQNLEATITIKNQKTDDEPGIEVDKTVTKESAVLVDGKATFDYAVKITNNGNRTLTNLEVVDEMTAPTGAAVIYNPEPDSTNSDGSAVFELDELEGGLAPGAAHTFHYSVTVDKAGNYGNLAQVSAWYGEEEVTGSDEESVTVKAPGLSIIKSVVGPDLITGSSGTFTYQLLIRNDGEMDLKNVEVKDVFAGSPDVTYEYAGSVPFNSATGTFTIGTLAAGAEDLVITYKVTVKGTGTHKNVATVSGFYEDPNQLDEYQQPILVPLEDSDDASVTVRKRSSDPPIRIPDEPTPQGPTTPEVILPEEEIPAGPALPKTGGGIDPSWLYGLGALLVGSGLGLRRRKEK